MDPKTKELIDACEERAAKASLGPWRFPGPDFTVVDHVGNKVLWVHESEDDGRFAAHAREAMPALCSAIREQDKRARHAEEELDAYDKRITELEAQLQERSAAARAFDTLAIARLQEIYKKQKRIEELEALISSGSDDLPTNEDFVRVAMVEHHGKSEMDQKYVREWSRRFAPALDGIRAVFAKNEQREPKQFGDTIVIVAPVDSSDDERVNVLNQAVAAHGKNVIVLSEDWRTLPPDEFNAFITARLPTREQVVDDVRLSSNGDACIKTIRTTYDAITRRFTDSRTQK